MEDDSAHDAVFVTSGSGSHPTPVMVQVSVWERWIQVIKS